MCTTLRGTSVWSVAGKVFGTVQVNRIREGTEAMACDEQGGFRRGRECMDQMYPLRQVSKKCLLKSKDVL